MNSGRGEKWVIGQFIFLAAIFLAPLISRAPSPLSILVGVLIGIAGGLTGLFSLFTLGSNLTVFPRPKEDGALVQTGVYGLVRHPIYSSVILVSLGWSVLWASLSALVLTILLAAYFDRKAYQEEKWLSAKYPDYASYRQRVHKLIPWIY